MKEFSQLLRIPILNQLPFNSTERDPKPEEISQALHLQQSDVITNWETRSGVMTKVPHQRSHCFTCVGLRRTGPSQLMLPNRVSPDPG